MSKDNPFGEPSYVYAPYVPMQVTPSIFGPVKRGWYAKAKLLHHDLKHETWEFAEGDLVKHVSNPENTIGTIVGIKQEVMDGPYMTVYDVIWGDYGPSE